MLESARSERLFVGSFANAGILTKMLERLDPPLVTFIPIGTEGIRKAVEDEACALYLKDLLEEIVGEIDDEFDQAVTPFRKLGENHYLLNSRMKVESLNAALYLDLPSGDYETLAGFIISQMGDLPRPGEQLHWRNLRFVVRGADARAIKEVELFVEPPSSA